MPANPQPAALSQAERLDAVGDRFEAQWGAGRLPRIEAFLAQADPADHDELFRQLLALEFELVQKSGAPLRPEEYRRRFPAHADVIQEAMARFAHLQASIHTSVAGEDSVRTGSFRPAAALAFELRMNDDPLPAQIGRFPLKGLLGAGAFGKVYRAADPDLGREVAIKVPVADAVKAPAEKDRFLREARAAATLQHPNVCAVHEIGEQDGVPFIVMALVPGQSLADLLKGREEPLPPKQIAFIVKRLALALEMAHKKGIVHRDLKPANIMFDREREDVVIMDFGLARAPTKDDATSTQSGVIMGTPAYMSPEQARGQAKSVGPAADIYSLGVILYELLTLQRPYAGTVTEVLGQILHTEPKRPSAMRPSVDPKLEAVCLKAMAKEPENRHATMRAFAAALEAPPPRPWTSRRILVTLGLLFLAGLITLGIIFFARTPTATVMVDLDVDLRDKSLSYILDGKGVSAAHLGKPLELTVGEHELLVLHGGNIVQQFRFNVIGGAKPTFEIKEVVRGAAKPTATGDQTSADPERQLAQWWIRKGGFVIVTQGDLPATFEALAAMPPLRKVEELPSGPFKLLVLDWQFGQLDDETRRLLPQARHLMRFAFWGGKFTDAELALMKDCVELRELYLDHTQVSDAGLASLTGLKKLKYFFVHNTAVRGAGLALLLDLPLEWIHLSGRIDAAGVDALCKFPRTMRQLDLVCPNLTAKQVRQLCGSLPKLSHMQLEGSEVSDADLTEIAKLKDLVWLNLAGARVNGDGLGALASMPRLFHLILNKTLVRNQALKPLAEVPALRILELNDTEVTDAAIDDLVKIRGLELLEVKGAKITPAGLRRLREALPRCRIEPPPPAETK